MCRPSRSHAPCRRHSSKRSRRQRTAGSAVNSCSPAEARTAPHVDISSARDELRSLRRTVAAIAAEHGLAILAAGTHPTAEWGKSRQTQTERYDVVMHDVQMIGRRNMLCALHVHVELPDADQRVDVMTRMLPYLPLFVALATSSPFWQSRPTALERLSVGGLRRVAAHWRARAVPHQGGIRFLCGGAGALGRDRGSKLYLVGNAAVPEASDPRITRTRLLHPGRRFRRDRRALPHARALARTHSAAQCGPYRRIARHRGREQVASAALRRARHLRQRGWRSDGQGHARSVDRGRCV